MKPVEWMTIEEVLAELSTRLSRSMDSGQHWKTNFNIFSYSMRVGSFEHAEIDHIVVQQPYTDLIHVIMNEERLKSELQKMRDENFFNETTRVIHIL